MSATMSIVIILAIGIVIGLTSIPTIMKWGESTRRQRGLIALIGFVFSLGVGVIMDVILRQMNTESQFMLLAVIEPCMVFAFVLVFDGFLDWKYRLVPRWQSVGLMIAQNIYTTVLFALMHQYPFLILSLVMSLIFWSMPLLNSMISPDRILLGMGDGRLLAVLTPAGLLAVGGDVWKAFLIILITQAVYGFIVAMRSNAMLSSANREKLNQTLAGHYPLAPFAGFAFLLVGIVSIF